MKHLVPGVLPGILRAATIVVGAVEVVVLVVVVVTAPAVIDAVNLLLPFPSSCSYFSQHGMQFFSLVPVYILSIIIDLPSFIYHSSVTNFRLLSFPLQNPLTLCSLEYLLLSDLSVHFPLKDEKCLEGRLYNSFFVSSKA